MNHICTIIIKLFLPQLKMCWYYYLYYYYYIILNKINITFVKSKLLLSFLLFVIIIIKDVDIITNLKINISCEKEKHIIDIIITTNYYIIFFYYYYP